MLNKTSSRDRE